MKPVLLIIDDDRDFAEDLSALLTDDYHCIIENSAVNAMDILKESEADLVLLDLMLDDGASGLDILSGIRQYNRHIPVIIITDYSSVDTAIEAMKRGAFNYISKTPNLNELLYMLEKAALNVRKEQERELLTDEIQKAYQDLIGSSTVMDQLRERIRLAALNLNTVLITGESGSGKELVARQLHLASQRHEKPFVAINCAAIPSELLESELFGHEKGAFTGANKRKAGKFELASEGILFLDEISELSPDAQVKLLRVIQEKEFTRVGGNESIRTGAVIIAATNRNLAELVENGKFREDLYYRLDVIPLRVPPLRERPTDIPELARHFLREICHEIKTDQKEFHSDTITLMEKYDWPGNVRQLKNYITRAAILSADRIITANEIDIPSNITAHTSEYSSPSSDSKNQSILQNILINANFPVPETRSEMEKVRKAAIDAAGREVERIWLKQLLEKFRGNVSKAADHAGINRSNLHKMMKRCGL